jgi:hypothetical protein
MDKITEIRNRSRYGYGLQNGDVDISHVAKTATDDVSVLLEFIEILCNKITKKQEVNSQ